MLPVRFVILLADHVGACDLFPGHLHLPDQLLVYEIDLDPDKVEEIENARVRFDLFVFLVSLQLVEERIEKDDQNDQQHQSDNAEDHKKDPL